jgi:small subunit ribosomal protein S5
MSQNKTPKDEVFCEQLVNVNRVTKVVEGGRKFSFSALVVTGDKAGSVGYATGKAKEVLAAKLKASQSAKKSLVEINLLDGRTICHDVYAKSGASKVILRKAKAGTGIIAGGAMRAVFESLGIHDIVAKSLGSNNPNTMIAATMKALMQVSSPRHIAERRGISTADLFVDSKPKKRK